MDSRGKLLSLFQRIEADLSAVSNVDESRRYAVERQASRLRKRGELGDESLGPKAVDDFLVINRRMGSFNVSIPLDVQRDARHYILVALERYTTSVADINIQVSLDRVHLLDLWRFGPGASFETKGKHTADKIRQPWTTSLNACPEVQRLRRNHPYLSAFDSVKQGLRQVRGSQLSTVPKNEDKARTIAFEPCGNMALQLAAHEYFKGTLRCIGLDLSTQQEKNRFLAKQGSITGALATLDLSNASDTIHPDLVRALLPECWFDLLMSIRSEEVRLPSGEWVKLEMISTMGNGFTFSLMTLLLAGLLYGYRCSVGGPTLYIDWKSSAIYGDDIIIPVSEYGGFCSLLEGCGFMVNHEKSFAEGPFRESCGGDYLNGYDVTPFYVRNLESDAMIYVALNKMAEWCGRNGVFLPSAFTFLFSCLRGALHFVPEWDQPDSGFKTTLVQRRYKKLQPLKVVLLIPATDMFLVSLACGGYVTSSANGATYMPRQHKTRYGIVRSRIPKGFLDGRDPLTRSNQVSSYCDFVAFVGMTLAGKAE